MDIYIDTKYGFSGDTLLSVLYGLSNNKDFKDEKGIPLKNLIQTVSKKLSNQDLVNHIDLRFINPARVNIIADEEKSSYSKFSSSKDIVDYIFNDEEINSIIQIKDEYKELAYNTLDLIIETEKEVCNKNKEYERIDRTLDIVLSSYGLSNLDIDNIYTFAKVNLGSGIINLPNGRQLSVPAPITKSLVETYDENKGKLKFSTCEEHKSLGFYFDHELTTPTGAAILIGFNATPNRKYLHDRIIAKTTISRNYDATNKSEQIKKVQGYLLE